MALNKFMHPRNLYKNPPDFDKLSKIYPEFSNIAKTDVLGKVTINFKDPSSLRILTRCLLKHDFNLDVEIPQERLVPTLPLRLNYVLWIEDILTACKLFSQVKGLDIGTGACAIYPLLATTRNKWNMVGTETDLLSYNIAVQNIHRNNLKDQITIIKNSTTDVLEYLFKENDEVTFSFCMCNPPFYSSLHELYDSRSPARPEPKNGFTGAPHELITEGGEIEFCRKLIKESKKVKDKVKVFTTMVGHKSNLEELCLDLQEEGLVKYTTTEFCQGRVTRWGLAWTYLDYNLYLLVPPRNKPRKKPTPITFILPPISNAPYNLETIYKKVIKILETLKIQHKTLSKMGTTMNLDLISFENTWSNQRRKRRLTKRIESECGKKIKSDESNTEGSNEFNSACRNIENNLTDSISKDETEETSSGKQPFVHAFLKLAKKDNDFILESEFIEGSAGKEGLHQIFQFIKNNWKYFVILFFWHDLAYDMFIFRANDILAILRSMINIIKRVYRVIRKMLVILYRVIKYR